MFKKKKEQRLFLLRSNTKSDTCQVTQRELGEAVIAADVRGGRDKVNRKGQSRDRSYSHQPSPQGPGPEIDWTRPGNSVKVWRKKKKKSASLNEKNKMENKKEKKKERYFLGFNSRVATLGGRLTNVDLMCS